MVSGIKNVWIWMLFGIWDMGFGIHDLGLGNGDSELGIVNWGL